MTDFLSFALPKIAGNFLHILPLLLVTVPLAEWLKRSGLAARYVPALKARPLVAIVVAAGLGALSPLCSCGVIPVIAGFLRAGMPLGPVMAFWIASPSMDPEIFALSAGTLGLPLALARFVAATGLSLAAGLAAHALERRGLIGRQSLRGSAAPLAEARPAPAFAATGRFSPIAEGRLRPAGAPLMASASPGIAAPSCGCGAPAANAAGGAASSAAALPAGGTCDCPASSLGSKALDLLRASLPEYAKLSLVMLLAFVLETLVIRFVPAELIVPVLGSDSPFGILLATLLGVPLYMTNLAALGLVSGLVSQGMSQGAALAFLLGGAATTLPAMTAVWSLTKPRVFAVYLGSIALGSLVAGYAWQALSALLGL